MQLQGKTVIITGGGTGMGRACAELFAKEGCAVAIAGRREGPLRDTVDAIVAAGGRAIYVVADMTAEEGAQKLAIEAARAFGGIDILICSAGVFISGKETLDFTGNDYEELWKINFLGTFYACQCAVPYMKQAGGGIIINITSVSAHVAHRGQCPYNASKAAAEMLSKTLALELGKHNIRVNTICPSMTKTDMATGAIERSGEEKIASWHPLGRMGEVADIAQGALYLASGQASWVSGNSLFIDGGITSKC